jgi:hypothetical protein
MLAVVMKNAKVEAKVACHGPSPCLVVDFRASAPPVLWRFDLEKNHSFSFGLQDVEGGLVLGVAMPDGAFHAVARFARREDAEEARDAVRKALMKRGRCRKWLKVLAVVVAALLVLFLVLASMGRPQAPAETAEQEFGVPQVADDILKPPPR